MRRRWWWLPVAVAIVGIAITVLVARISHGRARTARRDQLERAAAEIGFAVTERVRVPAEALQTIGAVIGHSPTVDRETFESIAQSVHARTPRIYAIEWAPLVTSAQRAELEARVQSEVPGWQIREPGSNGLVPAGERARYLPLLYVVPDNPAPGFDVLSRPEAAAVFDAACSSGRPVFSPRYRLVEDTEDLASVILYEPVWKDGNVPSDTRLRCRDVLGVGILIFRVKDMIGDAITRNEVASALDVTLDDITDDESVQILFETRPGAAQRVPREPHADVAVPLYGREWRLRIGDPTRAEPPFVLLAVGGGITFLATALACVIAWVMSNRRRLRSMTRLGQYRVEREIGRGSMGVVYQAQHLLLQRPAALKLLAPDLVDAASRRRFEREVRLAAKLQHPSVVQVYDFGVTAEGLFFYAMELLDGITVRDLVANHGPMPPARAAEIVRQIAQALREAHGKRIIHRDLAPANLMVTVRGEQYDVVKVLDFGLVKRIRTVAGEDDHRGSLTDAGIIIGSPGFIAPEVLRGKEADERVDIYALGAVWYTLLAGRVPFSGPTPQATINSQLRASPVALHKLVPELPSALVELVNDCLQPDPKARLRSMTEVLQRLDALGLPPWTQEQARHWWKTNRRS